MNELYLLIAKTYFFIIGAYMSIGLLSSILYKVKKIPVTDKMIRGFKFQVITVSIASKNVRGALLENIKHHKVYDHRVLIDEGSDMQRELERMGVDLIVVPREYQCNAIAKGRALNYFAQEVAKDDVWYVFIDDDNLILDDAFISEMLRYDQSEYMLANPVLIPRLGKSKIAYICDFVRYLDDISIFRLCTGLFKRPINGIHGELTIVKGQALRRITFNRWSITEDFAFSQEYMKCGWKTWQSETKVSIKSPNTIKDLMKQRKRWFVGIWMDLRNAHYLTKMFVLPRLILWRIGIFFSWIFVFLWWRADFFNIIALIGAMAYTISYVFGVLDITTKKGLSNILFFFLLPFYSVIEVASAWYPYNKDKFEVINKN
jgi:hypothetical protein